MNSIEKKAKLDSTFHWFFSYISLITSDIIETNVNNYLLIQI